MMSSACHTFYSKKSSCIFSRKPRCRFFGSRPRGRNSSLESRLPSVGGRGSLCYRWWAAGRRLEPKEIFRVDHFLSFQFKAHSLFESSKNTFTPFVNQPLFFQGQPVVAPSLWPAQVYRCGSSFHCPGGLPEQCAGDLKGVPCGECSAGASPNPWLKERWTKRFTNRQTGNF